MEKVRASFGKEEPREPQGFKQIRIEIYKAILEILRLIGKIDSEIKNLVIDGLKEKIGAYDIYHEVITTFDIDRWLLSKD